MLGLESLDLDTTIKCGVAVVLTILTWLGVIKVKDKVKKK